MPKQPPTSKPPSEHCLFPLKHLDFIAPRLSAPHQVPVHLSEVSEITRHPTHRVSLTPGKINMEPENTPLEKEKHLPNHHFQVLC